MTVDELNNLPDREATACFLRCCGSRAWAAAMIAARPWANLDELLTAADDAGRNLGEADWLEAFAAHPRIGDIESLREKFANTKLWAAGEQAGVAAADEAVLSGLAEGNAAYEIRFGFLFIVCATGKSAEEMLRLLRARLSNSRETELRIAADEQLKITKIRVLKMMNNPEQPA